MKSQSCSSDDEIWSYSPLARMSKRSKRETAASSETVVSPRPKRARCLDAEDKPRTVSQQHRRIRKKQLTLSSKKKTPVKSGKDAGSLEKREAEEEGYCPFCQMPFRILVVESANWHVSDCLSQPITALQECPSGLECDSTIQSHYHKYRHSTLAALRSGVKLTECHQSGLGKGTENSEVTVRSQQSSLAPMSPQPTDVTQCDVSQCDTVSCSGRNGPTTTHAQEAGVENSDTTDTKHVVTSGGSDSDDCDVFLRDISEMLGDAMEEDAEDIACHTAKAGVKLICQDATCDDGATSSMGDEDSFVKNKQLSNGYSQVNKLTDQYLTDHHDAIITLNIPAPVHHGNAVVYNTCEHMKRQSIQLSQSPRKQRTGSNVTTNQKSIDAFFKPMKSKILTRSTKEDKVSPQRHVMLQEGMQQQFSSDKPKLVPQNTACTVSRPVISDRLSTSDPSGSKGTSGWSRPVKKCPFYKWIPGTAFTVDAFSYGVIPGCCGYFLSHFHYDHYMGLRKSFTQLIYCSQVTANLVRKKIGVDVTYLHPLSIDTVHVINGVKVTFISANHCPGSVMILFQLQNGQVILHTGDFRANSTMECHLADVKVNQLFLDTTYCNPSYAFPPQDEVIRLAVKMSVDYLEQNPKGLIVVGSYTIGKERLFLAIAEAVNCHICVTSEKKTILLCLEDSSITKRLTLKNHDARVHVLPMSKLTYNGLCDYLDLVQSVFDSILAFQPTGWTHSKTTPSLQNLKPKIHRRDLTLYGLPYSEHSSYLEMKRFVQFLGPDKIIPTVNNGNPTSRNKMERLFQSWRTERRQDLPPEGSSLRQTGLSAWLK